MRAFDNMAEQQPQKSPPTARGPSIRPKLRNKASIPFNYIKAKADYLNIINHFNLKRVRYYKNERDFDRKWYEEVLKNLLQCEEYVKTHGGECLLVSPKHTCYHQFELLRDSDGTTHLIKRRRYPDDPVIKYLIIENSFDVFRDIHLQNNHCTRDEMRKIVRQKYEIRTIYIDSFVKCCNVCNRKKTVKLEFRAKTERGYVAKDRTYHVDVLHMTPDPDSNFKYILYFKDCFSSAIFLRPLMNKCYMEVASELLKIFMYIGPPVKNVIAGSASPRQCSVKFFNKSMQMLNTWGLQHKIEVEAGTRNVNVYEEIKKELKIWMDTTGSSNWALGCHTVQWKLNNRVIKHDSDSSLRGRRTPFEILFGQEPIQSSSNKKKTSSSDSEEIEKKNEQEIVVLASEEEEDSEKVIADTLRDS